MKKGGISMKKESSTLIVSIVIILIIALVGFNFQSITGYSSKAETNTKIEVYPKEAIAAGEYINVEVIPGSKCVNRYAYIYYAAGTGAKATLQPIGGSNKVCKPYTMSYKTQAFWRENPGVYFVKVFDYKSNDFVKDIFTIKGE